MHRYTISFLFNLVQTLRGHAHLSVYLLVCPVLVETALQCRVTPPQSLYTCLEALLWCVWRHFNKCVCCIYMCMCFYSLATSFIRKPMWYTGVILNELLTMLLPRLHQVLLLLIFNVKLLRSFRLKRCYMRWCSLLKVHCNAIGTCTYVLVFSLQRKMIFLPV